MMENGFVSRCASETEFLIKLTGKMGDLVSTADAYEFGAWVNREWGMDLVDSEGKWLAFWECFSLDDWQLLMSDYFSKR